MRSLTTLMAFCLGGIFIADKEMDNRLISIRYNDLLIDTPKVIISDENNSLEISPLSPFNNGVLIEPVNRQLNKGVSTDFFIKDTANWSFYTNGQKRLAINGIGNITSSVPLLINTNESDGTSHLRVAGNARFDSSISLKAPSDTLSFLSMNRTIQSAWEGEDDRISPYTVTPTAWAVDHHIPVLRIRHPNNVSSSEHPNLSVQRDFKILPYQFGMAIEYGGVVECWVGEWSIHRGDFYKDVEGKGNGWGAVSWVGDDQDGGGVRMTARNNLFRGGNVNYGEMSVEKFGGAPNGDLRLRLPSTQNQFHFIYGERGSENIVAKLTNEGLIIPKVPTAASTQSPEKAQLLFDSTDNKFKGYNGTEWISFSDQNLLTGSDSLSGNGSDLSFSIPHGLSSEPGYFNLIATSQDAANISYVTANDTHLIIHYTTAPPAGTNNLSWNWQVRK